ncbi:MAG: twin-arginine translocase subunit TatC [Candidatus Altiarchaeota archaeon]
MTDSFTDHLIELRRRTVSALIVFLIASVASYPLAQPMLLKIKSDMLPDASLVIIDPAEAVTAYVNVSLLMGFILALPATVYHMWAFLDPALRRQERKMMLFLIVPSVSLFLAGVAFGYFILVPTALRFLLDSSEPLATPMLSLASTISFVTTILLALGFLFQWPLITAVLGRLGFLKAGTLSQYRRHSIVFIILAAGIITPDPTIIPQLILSAPMMLLYETGIITSKIAGG